MVEEKMMIRIWVRKPWERMRGENVILSVDFIESLTSKRMDGKAKVN